VNIVVKFYWNLSTKCRDIAPREMRVNGRTENSRTADPTDDLNTICVCRLLWAKAQEVAESNGRLSV